MVPEYRIAFYGRDGEGNAVEMTPAEASLQLSEKGSEVLITNINGVDVSTVFLSIPTPPHVFDDGNDPNIHGPLLWETIVFGGPYDGQRLRYNSVKAAQYGHAAVVKYLEGNGPDPWLSGPDWWDVIVTG